MSALYTTLSSLCYLPYCNRDRHCRCDRHQGMKRKSRHHCMGITNIPMLNADIVTGISLMLLFIAVGSGLKYLGLIFHWDLNCAGTHNL